MTTTEILKEISRLPVSQQRELKEKLLEDSESGRQAISEDEFLRKLLADGFISEIPEGMTDEEDAFEPVEFEGEPISETIIRERR